MIIILVNSDTPSFLQKLIDLMMGSTQSRLLSLMLGLVKSSIYTQPKQLANLDAILDI